MAGAGAVATGASGVGSERVATVGVAAEALSRAAMRVPNHTPSASNASVQSNTGHSHVGVLRLARGAGGGSSKATSGVLSRRRSASDLRRASRISDIGSIQCAQQARAGQAIGQRHQGQGAGNPIGWQSAGILEVSNLCGGGWQFCLPNP